MKPNAIVTCCDAKYGAFLIDHWLRSLRENVNLSRIDVVVLDYGLTVEQAETLRALGVIVRPCVRDGHPVSIRYRDLAAMVSETGYEQVASMDGGDIIFQADISPLFERDKGDWRATLEPHFTGSIHVLMFGSYDLKPELRPEVLDFMRDRPVVNGGVIVGPAHCFVAFYAEMSRLCQTLTHFGTDQLIASYFLYKTGFVQLEERYNFVFISSRSYFRVRGGVFLGADGLPIPLVHNAGNRLLIRFVRNFGYGPDRNQVKWFLRAIVLCGRTVLFRWKRLWRPAPLPGAQEPQP